MTAQKSRRQEFRELINSALAQSPYNPQLIKVEGMTREQQLKFHFIWCTGYLGELLAYSAQDLMEVREHLIRTASKD